MLGVGLRKLCPQDSFGDAFRKKKTVRTSTPEGAKAARGGSKMVSGRPSDGSFVPVGPNLAAKAARKPCWGGSGGGALGALLALLEPSWGPPGPLLGRAWAPCGSPWAAPGGPLALLAALPGTPGGTRRLQMCPPVQRSS